MLILIRDVASKWEQLANELSVPKKEIEYIRQTTGGEDYDSLVEVCDWWIKQLFENKSQPTWKAVSKALKRIGFPDVAKEIMEIYKTGLCLFSYSAYGSSWSIRKCDMLIHPSMGNQNQLTRRLNS